MERRLAHALFLVALLAPPAAAWNYLGHKVVADIAWQQLDPATRERIVAVLRRGPRYDEDFAKWMPNDVDEGRWTFQQAATWPDMIRGNETYDHPTWHYVDFPLYIGASRPVTFNRSMCLDNKCQQWNVAQAVAHCRCVLAGDCPPQQKAIAYCWLFHLVGDLHQPLHATSLVCDRFPDGDQGGNKIRVVQGKNLHALWDNLLGRDMRMQDVQREVAELRQLPDAWKVDVTANVPKWLQESDKIGRSFAYSPAILAAVKSPGEMNPVNVPPEYLTEAGRIAQVRVIAAGVRLAALLEETSR